jgi:hypothetical protein
MPIDLSLIDRYPSFVLSDVTSQLTILPGRIEIRTLLILYIFTHTPFSRRAGRSVVESVVPFNPLLAYTYHTVAHGDEYMAYRVSLRLTWFTHGL